MSPLGFQCWVDVRGDILVSDGVVVQPKKGILKRVGGGSGFSEAGGVTGTLRPMLGAQSASFAVGGSGRTLLATGPAARYSGADTPAGRYLPTRPGRYVFGPFVMAVTGSGTAEITDGSGTVAELTGAAWPPVGVFSSTSYGETTYGPLVGGVPQPFALTVTEESAAPNTLPAAEVTILAGTAQGGQYTASDSATYVSAVNSAWGIVVDAGGDGFISDGTAVVAERPSGSDWDPSGRYVATSYGATTYNGGDPWEAVVALVPANPLAGTVYLQVYEVSGVLTAVTGPFFGTVPAPSPGTGTYYVPLAEVDGMGGAEQYVLGPIVWP